MTKKIKKNDLLGKKSSSKIEEELKKVDHQLDEILELQEKLIIEEQKLKRILRCYRVEVLGASVDD